MCGQRDLHLIIDIRPLWMMIDFFCLYRYTRHKTKGLVKVLKSIFICNSITSLSFFQCFKPPRALVRAAPLNFSITKILLCYLFKVTQTDKMIEARIVATMNVTTPLPYRLIREKFRVRKFPLNPSESICQFPLLYGAQMIVSTPLYKVSRDRPGAARQEPRSTCLITLFTKEASKASYLEFLRSRTAV